MTWGKWYWPIYILVGFLVPEIVACKTNWRNTLSAWVWHFERFTPHQPIGSWSWRHVLFLGSFTSLFVWLFGHFGFGWWRK